MSKTTRAVPFRSTSWPVCRSVSRGRASRSARKSVRRASVAEKAQAGQKARERRARRQVLALEQGHEGLRKMPELFIERLQGPFPADSVAEKHGQKINHLIVPEAATGQTHLRVDRRKDDLLAKIGDQQRDLPEPAGCRGDRVGRGLDTH